MNIEHQHDPAKEVSAIPIFKDGNGTTIAIQLQANATLKEHITKTPALLVCVSGDVIYEDESGVKLQLKSGDYIEIAPEVKHWLNAKITSQLLLCK